MSQLLLIQMYDRGARVHAEFRACCRRERETLPRPVSKAHRLVGWLSSLLFVRTRQRWFRTFHLRIREKISNVASRPVRNLTEIGLEILREGWVNFRHLVVVSPSARRQKSHLQQKSNYPGRTTKGARLFLWKRHRDLNASVTNAPPQSKLLVKP